MKIKDLLRVQDENMDKFLKEQHDTIRLLKLTIRGQVADKLFKIVSFAEEIAKTLYLKKKFFFPESTVFSMSTNQVTEVLKVSKNKAHDYLTLASALGLVKRITIEEAGGNSEYFGELGIGIQQYLWSKIDKEEVLRRWRLWIGNPMRKLKDLTLTKVANIFGSSVRTEIETHKEATDIYLRQLMREERAHENDKMVEEIKEQAMNEFRKKYKSKFGREYNPKKNYLFTPEDIYSHALDDEEKQFIRDKRGTIHSFLLKKTNRLKCPCVIDLNTHEPL
jgi:hypothetical protein